jgi:hypothetical protein
MGLMRFKLPSRQISDEIIKDAYLSGIDRAPWPVRTTVEDGILVLYRAESDSANLHFCLPLDGIGPLVFSTASLMERDAPYSLILELARGTVGQLTDQLYQWTSIGLIVSENLTKLIHESVARLSVAAMSQDDPQTSENAALQAIRIAYEAGNQLSVVYAEQALAVRRKNEGKISTLVGVDLGLNLPGSYSTKHILSAFDIVNIPIRWREIEALEGQYDWSLTDQQFEWCRQNGLKITAGPLLSFDAFGLPDWLMLWEGDFDNLLSFFTEYIRIVVERFRGKVNLWNCVGRMNVEDFLSLSEEEYLRLTAAAIETVRSLDPDVPVIASFDQPWGEYMSRRKIDVPPMHFADALIRSELGLSGIMLEINTGYHPGGTLFRNPLEFSRELDIWSVWGLPIWLSVSAPSLCDADPLARRNLKLPQESWTPIAQAAWVARYVPIILAKNFVQGIVWNQLHDSRPHEFPYAGLFDLRRRAKPAMRTFTALRQKVLNI